MAATEPRAGGVDQLHAREAHRLAVDQFLQLGERHEGTGQGHRANQNRDTGGDDAHGVRVPATEKLRAGHGEGGAAAETVEQGHQLRHGGHLYFLGQDAPMMPPTITPPMMIS